MIRPRPPRNPLHEVVSKRTWLGTLSLLLGAFWILLPLAVIFFGFVGALFPLVAALFVQKFYLAVWFLPTLLGSPVVVWLLGWLLVRFGRAEAAQLRLVTGESVTPGLTMPPGRNPYKVALRLVVNPTLWRTIGYWIARGVLTVATALITFLAWYGPGFLITVVVVEFFFSAHVVLPDGSVFHNSYTNMAVFRDSSWPFWLGAFLLAGLLLLMLAPVLVRAMVSVHLALTRTMLEPKSAADLAERVQQVEERRAVAMQAAEAERQRIERDLHDGAQQQLVALAMKLGRARSRHGQDPDGALKLIEEAHQEAKDAIDELRNLTRGLHPPVLEDRGLDAALSALSARCPVPVRIRYYVEARPSQTIEAIAYFMISEALTNIAKHAHASKAAIEVRRTGERLTVVVTDDGIGGAKAGPGSGLAGLADRAGGVDGTLTLYSPEGGPTILTMELPCES
ncbi:histidine kinase [Crossiella sp. CA198]|uniref:sensor histidine kinase n=1 Tax=Crossiella sp. CA198 TaxID=3455607 RepID=UPI003F8CFEF3